MTATTAGAEHCRAEPCVRRFCTYQSNNGANLAQSEPVGDERLALIAEVRLLAKEVESLAASGCCLSIAWSSRSIFSVSLRRGSRSPARGFSAWEPSCFLSERSSSSVSREMGRRQARLRSPF